MFVIDRNEKTDNLLTYSYSILISTIIVMYFLLTSNEMHHPFIIPIYLTGIIIGFDLIRWLRGKVKVFDPVGFIGVFGYHFFFIAPMLQIYWEKEMSYVIQPDNWQTWVMGMGFINLIGIIIYKISLHYFDKKTKKTNTPKPTWKLNTNKLLLIIVPTLIIMFLLQSYIYISFGGISGYVNNYVNREGGFEGMGFLFMISESFPILFFILIIQLVKDKKYAKSIFFLLILFIIFFILKLYFGGLRGSRSNTVWGIIWAVGIIDLLVKKISRKTIIIGGIFLLVFVFIYGIYKGGREDFLDAVYTDASLLELSEETGRGIETVLLGDLSRSQTQSYILHKLVEYPENYELAYGRSYLGDLAILIPKKIYPERPPTKVKEGTEIIRGTGNYKPDVYVSSRIYGLTGEYMLNFGYISAPLIFIVLGYFISKTRNILYKLEKNDARLYLYPYLVIMCFLILVQDLDNLIFSVIKNLFIPLLIIIIVKEKHEDKEEKHAYSIRS